MSPAPTAWLKALLVSASLSPALAQLDGVKQDSPRQASQQILAAGFQNSRESACPNYLNYASTTHPPLSAGNLGLPFQRPAPRCRTFHSPLVEKVIWDVTSRMTDPDLAGVRPGSSRRRWTLIATLIQRGMRIGTRLEMDKYAGDYQSCGTTFGAAPGDAPKRVD